ncbi:MAG: hypothetical protein KKC18_11330 [Chloroflexi bacterium]|nr:hypothetical protein [Chloroflexota bacterium]
MEKDLTRSIVALFDQLTARDVDYLLVGGLALLRYIAGRNTEDVDIIIAASDLEQLEGLVVEKRDTYFVQGRFHDLRVDGLLTTNPLFTHVKQVHADHLTFRGQTIPCATIEGLILLKLYALPSLYRQGLFDKVALYETDVMMLLQAHTVEMGPLFKTLQDYLSTSDVETLHDIHREIVERIKARQTRFAGKS